jgi:hypothetical protein
MIADQLITEYNQRKEKLLDDLKLKDNFTKKVTLTDFERNMCLKILNYLENSKILEYKKEISYLNYNTKKHGIFGKLEFEIKFLINPKIIRFHVINNDFSLENFMNDFFIIKDDIDDNILRVLTFCTTTKPYHRILIHTYNSLWLLLGKILSDQNSEIF